MQLHLASRGTRDGSASTTVPRMGAAPADGANAPRAVGRDRAGLVAAVLAFASAAVTLFWLLGGTLGLSTVGGELERLARERSAPALALATGVVVAKLAVGALALALADRRRPRRVIVPLGLVGGGVLALYGGVLVGVGGLVLTGIVDPAGPRDELALRWHVCFWDLWFLVWGVALLLAALGARHRRRDATAPPLRPSPT